MKRTRCCGLLDAKSNEFIGCGPVVLCGPLWMRFDDTRHVKAFTLVTAVASTDTPGNGHTRASSNQ